MKVLIGPSRNVHHLHTGRYNHRVKTRLIYLLVAIKYDVWAKSLLAGTTTTHTCKSPWSDPHKQQRRRADAHLGPAGCTSQRECAGGRWWFRKLQYKRGRFDQSQRLGSRRVVQQAAEQTRLETSSLFWSSTEASSIGRQCDSIMQTLTKTTVVITTVLRRQKLRDTTETFLWASVSCWWPLWTEQVSIIGDITCDSGGKWYNRLFPPNLPKVWRIMLSRMTRSWACCR